MGDGGECLMMVGKVVALPPAQLLPPSPAAAHLPDEAVRARERRVHERPDANEAAWHGILELVAFRQKRQDTREDGRAAHVARRIARDDAWPDLDLVALAQDALRVEDGRGEAGVSNSHSVPHTLPPLPLRRRLAWRMEPPATPPLSECTSSPGLFTSNERMTMRRGEDVKSRTGMGTCRERKEEGGGGGASSCSG